MTSLTCWRRLDMNVLCSPSFVFASMCSVCFYGIPLSDDICIHNGLRFPALTFTLACVTRILISAFVILDLSSFAIKLDTMRPLMSQRIHCINCNICVNSSNTQSRYLVFDQNTRVISLISNWISPVIVSFIFN